MLNDSVYDYSQDPTSNINHSSVNQILVSDLINWQLALYIKITPSI
jgi:hypothetical protein